jgi:polyhydroxyalkanoate synthesis regulator phasin
MITGIVDFNSHKEFILAKSKTKMQEMQDDKDERDRVIEDQKNEINILKLKYEDLRNKYQKIKNITEGVSH